MSFFTGRLHFLTILAENARNPYPGVVGSETIASRLNLSLRETRQMIKCLNDMGVIESDIEGQHSLITQKGMQWLERYQTC